MGKRDRSVPLNERHTERNANTAYAANPKYATGTPNQNELGWLATTSQPFPVPHGTETFSQWPALSTPATKTPAKARKVDIRFSRLEVTPELYAFGEPEPGKKPSFAGILSVRAR